MKQIGKVLVTIVVTNFIGAITFYTSSALVYALTRFGNWTQSLPIWGICIVFVILGYIVMEIWKKIPKSKED